MTDKPFIDTDEWNLNAPESPKSYMTLDQMNEINDKADELDINKYEIHVQTQEENQISKKAIGHMFLLQ